MRVRLFRAGVGVHHQTMQSKGSGVRPVALSSSNFKVKTRRRSRGEILGSWHLCQFLTPLPLYIPALQLSWFLGPRAIHVVVQRSSLSICSARRREGGWQQKVVATTREIVCFQRVPKTIRKTGGCRYVQIKVPQKEAAFPETCYCQFIQGSNKDSVSKS